MSQAFLISKIQVFLGWEKDQKPENPVSKQKYRAGLWNQVPEASLGPGGSGTFLQRDSSAVISSVNMTVSAVSAVSAVVIQPLNKSGPVKKMR